MSLPLCSRSRPQSFLILLCLCFSLWLSCAADDPLPISARRLPKDLTWHPFPEACDMAHDQEKPLLVLVTETGPKTLKVSLKVGPGASEFLKRKMERHSEFNELAKKVVLVSLEGDEIVEASSYSPTFYGAIFNPPPRDRFVDKHAPRVYILDKDCVVQPLLTNGRVKGPYYFTNVDTIVENLEEVLDIYGDHDDL